MLLNQAGNPITSSAATLVADEPNHVAGNVG
jgi:hypothetical protein